MAKEKVPPNKERLEALLARREELARAEQEAFIGEIPERNGIEVFLNEGGGISLKSTDGYNLDPIVVSVDPRDVPALIALLHKAVRVHEKYAHLSNLGDDLSTSA